MIYGDEDFLTENFKRVDGGWIAYKTFNMMYPAPDEWVLECDSWIYDDLDTATYAGCSYGINVGPSVAWLHAFVEEEGVDQDNYGDISADVWKVFIPDEATIVIPDHTRGKIRVSRLKLLDTVDTVLYGFHPDCPWGDEA